MLSSRIRTSVGPDLQRVTTSCATTKYEPGPIAGYIGVVTAFRPPGKVPSYHSKVNPAANAAPEITGPPPIEIPVTCALPLLRQSRGSTWLVLTMFGKLMFRSFSTSRLEVTVQPVALKFI